MESKDLRFLLAAFQRPEPTLKLNYSLETFVNMIMVDLHILMYCYSESTFPEHMQSTFLSSLSSFCLSLSSQHKEKFEYRRDFQCIFTTHLYMLSILVVLNPDDALK